MTSRGRLTDRGSSRVTPIIGAGRENASGFTVSAETALTKTVPVETVLAETVLAETAVTVFDGAKTVVCSYRGFRLGR